MIESLSVIDMKSISSKTELYELINELRKDARNGRIVGFVKKLKSTKDTHERLKLLHFVARNLEKKGYKLTNECVASFFK